MPPLMFLAEVRLLSAAAVRVCGRVYHISQLPPSVYAAEFTIYLSLSKKSLTDFFDRFNRRAF